MEKENQGFTLIEVILAVAILAFIFLPMMKYFTDSARVNRLAKDKQNASFLAESLLETVRSVEVAEDLKSPLEKKGLTEVTETNRRKTDYRAEYRGWVSEDDSRYFAELVVDFSEDEVKTYNSSREAELFPFSGATDVIAEEGGQQEAAIDYFSDLNNQARATMESPPAALSREEIRGYLSREIHMKVEKQRTAETSYKISVWYVYTCNDGLGCGGEKYDTSENSRYLLYEVLKNAADWESFYFYYNPLNNSHNTDEFFLDTNGEDISLERFYLVCQTGGGNVPTMNLSGCGYLKNCKLYSNANIVQRDSALEKAGLIETKEARRVAKVTVNIYEKEPQEGEALAPLVTIETRKGE